MEVQVRHGGALDFFSNVKDAYDFAKGFNSFKLSWKNANKQDFRIFPKLKVDKWNPFEEKKIWELCPRYQNAKLTDRFFVNIPMSVYVSLLNKFAKKEILVGYSTEDAQEIIMGMSIVQVFTEDEFMNKYCQ
jgi:hypothetical protein